MKFFNRETGRRGEDLAADYLKSKGFEIIERNFSSKFGEIDIIAGQNGATVFVEVKTKKGTEFGMPEEMISPGKLRKIRNMATIYLNGASVPCRIDVVAIVLDTNNQILSLKHYENVY